MYLFILGKNFELSFIELLSYLKRKGFDFRLLKYEDRFVLIDIPEGIKNPETLINDLGGTLRIANIVDVKQSLKAIDLKSFELPYTNKFNFTVSDINLADENVAILIDELKHLIKDYKLKPQLKKAKKKSGNFNLLKPSLYHSWKLHEGFEMIVTKIEHEYYLAKTISCTNPKKYEALDEERPERLFTHGTSFRIAQIMVNILGLEDGKTIVDPFCGTGTFLLQGMLSGYNVVGIDKYKELIEISQKNIDWLKTKFSLKSNAHLINGLAESYKFQADACVFEPYMGPFLKELPNKNDAQKIISELNELYFNTFRNLNKNLAKGAKIVCILPDIETKTGNILAIDRKSFLQNGFKYVDLETYYNISNLQNPIKYVSSAETKILRNIYILEKI